MTRFNRQRGAALFVAIFLITVIVLVAALLALTSATQHTGQARAAAADGAWYAAVARLETAIPGILSSNSCPAGSSEDLFGYTTTLSCSRQEVSEGGNSYGVFTLEVTARQGSLDQAIFVRRSLKSQISGLENP